MRRRKCYECGLYNDEPHINSDHIPTWQLNPQRGAPEDLHSDRPTIVAKVKPVGDRWEWTTYSPVTDEEVGGKSGYTSEAGARTACKRLFPYIQFVN